MMAANGNRAPAVEVRLPCFPLGQVVITANALSALGQDMEVPMGQIIARHQAGDWGEMPDDDKLLNDEALHGGGRLMSAYTVGAVKVWIITEADRSSTCILLPEDY